MNKNMICRVLNLVAALVTIAFNAMANILPLNGLNTGQISDRFEVYFVPAGYVFSIWGLIYLGWLAFAVYQLLPAQRDNERLQKIGFWFVLSCIANMAWLYLWHFEYFIFTLVAMLALLATLIVMYERLEIGQISVSRKEFWLVNLPFSIYLGWITVATIANVTSVLDYLNWNGWGISPEIWTAIMLAVGVILAFLMNRRRADVAYLLVLIWAFAGIAIKHVAVPFVNISAWLAVVLVGLILIRGVFSRRPIY